MKICVADRLLKADDGEFYRPFVRYVVTEWQFGLLFESTPNTHWHWSQFASYERRYGGQDANGKRIAVYRHAAVGDQLIASAVPRYIKTLYPEAIVHLFCTASVAELWKGNHFVEGHAIPTPMVFDALVPKINPKEFHAATAEMPPEPCQGYDFHIFYEGMLEGNSEPDQNNCYDDMFAFCGLRDVPARFKRPFIARMPSDYKFVRDEGINVQSKYMVYHMSPDNANRRYPPKKSAEFLRLFLFRHADWSVIVVGTDKGHEYDRILFDLEDRHQLRFRNLIGKTPSIRDLIPIMENANLVICPDSAIMHMAAALSECPVISLWGVFHPNDRLQYYPNSYPIFHRTRDCPFAPCRDHNFKLPKDHCIQAKNAPEYKEQLEHCCALDGIAVEEILEKCAEVM